MESTSNKINIIPFLKFHIVIGALLGFLLGVIYSFGGLIVDVLVSLDSLSSKETPGLSYGTALAFGALLGMPIIFATTGLLFGLLQFVIYNLFSKFLSGLDLDFELKNKN